MKEQKYYLVFDKIERGIILRSLNELHNRFFRKGDIQTQQMNYSSNLQIPRKRTSKITRTRRKCLGVGKENEQYSSVCYGDCK